MRYVGVFLLRIESNLGDFSLERESVRARAWPFLADIPTNASSKKARGQVHSSNHTRRLARFISHIAALEADFAEANLLPKTSKLAPNPSVEEKLEP